MDFVLKNNLEVLFKDGITEMTSLSDKKLTRIVGLDNITKTTKFYDGLVEKITNRAGKIGKNSSTFLKLRNEILLAVKNRNDLIDVIETIDYLRPLFELWRNKEIDVSKNHIYARLINHLNKIILSSPKKKLSYLAVLDLCQTFFVNFKSLNEDRDNFGSFVAEQLKKIRSSSRVAILNTYSEFIFNHKGAFWFAKESNSRGVSLEKLLDEFGILRGSEFHQQAQLYRYYVEVDKLNANEFGPVLNEITDPSVYETKVDSTRRLGHVLLETLIDKLHKTNVEPNDIWKDTILKIAGDPRVAETDMHYRIWWKVLGRERTNYMLSWLSKFDMDLFLDIVEKYTKSYPDKERMFKRRKEFLQNVFSNNVVAYTRLFISSEVEDAVRKALENEHMPSFTHLKGGDAVFYYQVAGAHVIEGVHSFSMRILDKIPIRSEINSYNAEILMSEFRTTLRRKAEAEFGQKNFSLAEIPHDPAGNWVFITVRKLQKYGVNFDFENLFTKAELRYFLRGGK